MKNYKLKYITEAQAGVIEKMLEDGHHDTLVSFGCECINFNKVRDRRIVTNGVLIGMAVGIVACGARAVYRKWKETEKVEEKKPEREYVMV